MAVAAASMFVGIADVTDFALDANTCADGILPASCFKSTLPTVLFILDPILPKTSPPLKFTCARVWLAKELA